MTSSRQERNSRLVEEWRKSWDRRETVYLRRGRR
jgi:hypothetical protein